jgi:hypothetical protein
MSMEPMCHPLRASSTSTACLESDDETRQIHGLPGAAILGTTTLAGTPLMTKDCLSYPFQSDAVAFTGGAARAGSTRELSPATSANPVTAINVIIKILMEAEEVWEITNVCGVTCYWWLTGAFGPSNLAVKS